ncbi:hypothetical protein Pelo_5180 [Pelomyxa schiedti]|nr:hypothetical protein Pelo_5180 [Pelomyxa schiedti]
MGDESHFDDDHQDLLGGPASTRRFARVSLRVYSIVRTTGRSNCNSCRFGGVTVSFSHDTHAIARATVPKRKPDIAPRCTREQDPVTPDDGTVHVARTEQRRRGDHAATKTSTFMSSNHTHRQQQTINTSTTTTQPPWLPQLNNNNDQQPPRF